MFFVSVNTLTLSATKYKNPVRYEKRRKHEEAEGKILRIWERRQNGSDHLILLLMEKDWVLTQSRYCWPLYSCCQSKQRVISYETSHKYCLQAPFDPNEKEHLPSSFTNLPKIYMYSTEYYTRVDLLSFTWGRHMESSQDLRRPLSRQLTSGKVQTQIWSNSLSGNIRNRHKLKIFPFFFLRQIENISALHNHLLKLYNIVFRVLS